MAGRKAGNPDEDASAPIRITIPRGGDWLDVFNGEAPAEEPAAPQVDADSTSEPVTVLTPPEPTPELVETEAIAAEPEAEAAPAPPKKKAVAKTPRKSGPEPAAKKRKKQRPRRADIGFRSDLEEAAAKLRRHVIAHAQEDYVTRTDVIAQATCAVARAIDTINCGQVPRRGHYASASAEAYDAALQEAFYKGAALHFIEKNVHVLPDRLLELCYQHYRQRNGMED